MIIKITKAFSEAMVAFIGLWLLSGGLWMNGKSLYLYYLFFTLKYFPYSKLDLEGDVHTSKRFKNRYKPVQK